MAGFDESPGFAGKPARHRVESTRIVHRGSKFNLRTDTLSLLGREPEAKDIIDHPGSVVIVPITDAGELLMVEQWRPAIERYSLELPSGTREHDEPPVDTAQRELREEAGFNADEMRHLGGLYPVTGYSTEYSHVFEARGLTFDPLAQDKLEDILAVPKSGEEVWRLVAQNLIDDALTLASIALASETVPELKRL